MLITPIKPKTVTFSLPPGGASSHQRAATAPPRVHRKEVVSPPSGAGYATTTTTTTRPHSSHSSRTHQPDLIRDILDQPDTVHPKKIKAISEQTRAQSPTRPMRVGDADLMMVPMKEVRTGRTGTEKNGGGGGAGGREVKGALGRVLYSGQAKLSKAKAIRGGGGEGGTASKHRQSHSELVTKITHQVSTVYCISCMHQSRV